jgi:hypothetical protein|tara:strand:- start:78 stop:368 length:291 start_codon:yes stop_codon:yes gene_type:complete
VGLPVVVLVGMLKKSSRLTLLIEMSVPLRRITEDKMSIVDRTSVILGSADIVVVMPDSSLAELEIVSPAVNEPLGMLRVIVVELGLVRTTAVDALV